MLWRDEEIARLEAGDDPLKPVVVVLSDEHLTGPDKEKVQERLNTWITELIGERLKPLVEIASAKDILGLARGIAFRLTENFGVLRRESVTEEVRALDQPARAQLRKYGVRFGAFNIYFPAMLKPASTELALVLWTLKNGAAHGLDLATMPGAAARRASRRCTPAAGTPDEYLSRRRLPPVRSARGAHRHAGAPRRPDPRAGVLAHERGQSGDRRPRARPATAASRRRPT